MPEKNQFILLSGKHLFVTKGLEIFIAKMSFGMIILNDATIFWNESLL